MATPEETRGLTKIGRKWKVQTYLSDDAATALAEQAEVSGQPIGSIVAAIVEKVAAGANPVPTEKIVAAMKLAAQARRLK